MLYNIRNSKSKKKLELKVYNETIEQVNHLSVKCCLSNKAHEIWNALPASFHKLMDKKTFNKY